MVGLTGCLPLALDLNELPTAKKDSSLTPLTSWCDSLIKRMRVGGMGTILSVSALGIYSKIAKLYFCQLRRNLRHPVDLLREE